MHAFLVQIGTARAVCIVCHTPCIHDIHWGQHGRHDPRQFAAATLVRTPSVNRHLHNPSCIDRYAPHREVVVAGSFLCTNILIVPTAVSHVLSRDDASISDMLSALTVAVWVVSLCPLYCGEENGKNKGELCANKQTPQGCVFQPTCGSCHWFGLHGWGGCALPSTQCGGCGLPGHPLQEDWPSGRLRQRCGSCAQSWQLLWCR